MRINYWFLLLLLPVQMAFAGSVAEKMTKHFNKIGGVSNVTDGGVYRDQMGGYYSGGSIYARSPTSNLQPVNIQMPSIAAGCNGIDAFFGSFSHINSKQLVSLIKQIPMQVASYGVMLGIDTLSPKIGGLTRYLQGAAQQFNDRTINSCQTSSNIAGGMFPKSAAAKKLVCSSQGTSSGLFGDWAAAQQKCNDEQQREKAFAQAKNGQFQDVLGEEFNLAWQAMRKDLSVDDELSELFMTITGTIISKKAKNSKDGYQIKYFPSRIKDEKLIKAFLDGDQHEKFILYKCADNDKTTCLSLREVQENPIKEGFLAKVNSLLSSINNKVNDDDDNAILTNAEKSLINNTQIPIYKIIAVQAAFRKGHKAINHQEYAEMIAYDLFLGYLQTILDLVAVNSEQLRKVQVDDSIIKDFQKNIEQNRRYILSERTNMLRQINIMLSVIERFKLVERQLINQTANASLIEG
jgi:conjugative transfer pilus assembly protein TraH